MKLFKRFAAMMAFFICAMFGAVLMQSCSDDDGPDVKLPAPITEGEIPSKNVFLFVNGKYMPRSSDSKTEVIGSFDSDIITRTKIEFMCTDFFVVTNGSRSITTYPPRVELEVVKEDGRYTFEGAYNNSYYDYKITGEIVTNQNGENEWFVHVDQSVREYDNPFAGKTYEISISPESVFPHLFALPDLNPEPGPLVEDFFNKLPYAVVENSGYDAIRIKFNNDHTYEIWFHNVETGDYIKDESEHMYFYDMYFLCFVDEADFISSQADDLNLKPMGINAACAKNAFAQEQMRIFTADLAPRCVTSMLPYRGPENSKTTYYWNPYMMNFFSLWTGPDEITTQAEKNYVFLKDNNIDNNFTMMVEFHEVTE